MRNTLCEMQTSGSWRPSWSIPCKYFYFHYVVVKTCSAFKTQQTFGILHFELCLGYSDWERKENVPKDHLFYPLLYYFLKYLRLSGCEKRWDDWLEQSRRFTFIFFLFYMGNVYVSSHTILKTADWQIGFLFLCWLEGTFGWEVLFLSRSMVTALGMDNKYEWDTRDAVTSTATLPGPSYRCHTLQLQGILRQHAGVGTKTFPAEKRVLPLKGRIRAFPNSEVRAGEEGAGEEKPCARQG